MPVEKFGLTDRSVKLACAALNDDFLDRHRHGQAAADADATPRVATECGARGPPSPAGGALPCGARVGSWHGGEPPLAAHRARPIPASRSNSCRVR